MRWVLREMTAADIDWVVALERELFRLAWTQNAFREELASRHAFCYLACRYLPNNGTENAYERVGYCCFQLILDEMHLLKIAVRLHSQKNGVGQWMLRKCFDIAQEKGAATVYLEVRPSNGAARNLYRNAGFKMIGRRPGYYAKDKEDALVLQNNLKEGIDYEYQNRY